MFVVADVHLLANSNMAESAWLPIHSLMVDMGIEASKTPATLNRKLRNQEGFFRKSERTKKKGFHRVQCMCGQEIEVRAMAPALILSQTLFPLLDNVVTLVEQDSSFEAGRFREKPPASACSVYCTCFAPHATFS